MFISDAFAQTAPAVANDPFGGIMGSMLFPIALLAIFFFFIIRPQQKKAKDHQKMVTSLQKGDEIVTSGGLAGRISKVGENYLTLSVAEAKDGSVDVIVQKSAVTALLPKGTLKTL